jgi:uncharacterized protein (TIGR02147 family)
MININIFDYLDYREFLRSHYQLNKDKNKYFSLRYISQKTGLDPSFYLKVLNKKKHIAEKDIPILATFFKLNKRETEYFTNLIKFNKAKRPEEEQLYFEKMLKLRTPISRLLEKDRYDFFSSWKNVAIWELIKIIEVKGDFNDLASRFIPSITPGEAKRSVELLERLGMIRKDENNVYKATEKFVSSDGVTCAVAIRNFQKEVGLLAVDAIDKVPKENRDISTLTLSTSQECLELIRNRLSEVRKEIMELVNKFEKSDEVYQLNFQIFPLTQNKKIDRKNENA